jgi:L-arabinose isomerase
VTGIRRAVTSAHATNARIAILVPYSALWEAVVGAEVRADRLAIAELARDAIADAGDVVVASAIGSREEGHEAGEAIRRHHTDVVLVVETMATQPAFTLAALDRVDCPLVIWWAQTIRLDAGNFDSKALVLDGGAVGTPMLTSVLVRHERPFELITSPMDGRGTHHALQRSVGAAVAAARLRKSRIAKVGAAIDGYDCLDVDRQLLLNLIGDVIEVPPSEIRARFRGVRKPRVDAIVSEIHSDYEVAEDVSNDAIRLSATHAALIDDLCTERLIDAGAMNCHVDEIRFAPVVGVTPCFALGRSTTRGIPWTCAGDILTAVPMLMLKLLGAPTLYHELEAYDGETGEFIVANTGEHDLNLTSSKRPRFVVNEWFRQDERCSGCVSDRIRTGPAALVGFTQVAGKNRLIVAPGEVTERAWPLLRTVNGSFRFASGLAGWQRWCEAGALHHSVLTDAAAIDDLRKMTRLLPLEFIEID